MRGLALDATVGHRAGIARRWRDAILAEQPLAVRVCMAFRRALRARLAMLLTACRRAAGHCYSPEALARGLS